MRRLVFGLFFITFLSLFSYQPMAGQTTEYNYYTFDCTTGNEKNNSWQSWWEFTSEGVGWKLYNVSNYNGYWDYMRFGGKANSSGESYCMSTSAIKGITSKVVFDIYDLGIGGSFFINSIKLLVSKDLEFSVVYDQRTQYPRSTTTNIEFVPSEGKAWEDVYYKFVFDWKNDYANGARGMDLNGIKFYTTSPIVQHVGAATYSTLYYSKVALTVPENVSALTYRVTDGMLVVGKEYKSGETIPAGEAVVVKSSAKGDYTFDVSEEKVEADAENMLKGCDWEAETTGGSIYYKLSLNNSGDAGSVGFYWGAEGGGAFVSGAHKAYLALQETAPKSFLIRAAATAVEKPCLAVDRSKAAYNIAGQRVGAGYKGLVITNGKKSINK